MEVAMDERVSGEEGLRLAQRLEPLHLAFSPPCRSMRVLGAVSVDASVRRAWHVVQTF